jgi:CRISPR-associated protein Csm4
MNYFRVRLELAGPVVGSNPWQADTIFGHLCWALRYADGVAELRRFLDAYQEPGEPPILVSNGFPGDLLPRPLHLEHLPASPPGPHANTAGEGVGSEAEEAFAYHRDLRKRQYLTPQEFQDARESRPPAPGSRDPENVVSTRVTLKNQINRLTNTTGEGGQLFGFEETFYLDRDSKVPQVTIYCAVAESYGATQAQRLFRALEASGYGKRKAVGYGAISHLDWQPFPWFPDVPGANAAVSLSNFVPARGDPTKGWWKTLVKYGRLGEEFASSLHPFKRPVIMLQAGTVLLDPSPRPYYGRLVRGVSFLDPGIVQYGYALAVPLRVPREMSV